MTASPTTGSISPIDSSEETREERSNRHKAIGAAGIGWGLDGYTWTMYGFALTAAMPVLGMTSSWVGWVTALSIVASAFGGVIAGTLADRLGRVRVLTYVILGYCLFTTLTATSQNGVQFIIWRILEGLTFGGEWAVGAALVAEYAKPHHRGRALAIVQSCYALGWALSTAAYLAIFSLAPHDVAWRYLFLIGLPPAVLAFVIRKTTKDAVRVASTTGKRSTATVLRELFAPGQARVTIFATVLGIGIQVIYYSVFVFLPTFLRDERGLSVVGTATYTWLAIAGSFTGYVFAGFLLDWIGRRLTFLLFFLGSAASVSLFVLTPTAAPALGLFIIFLLGFFASGQAGGTGAYLAELFPTRIRATGQALAYNFGRGLAAFGPLTVGLAAGAIGWGESIMIMACVGAAIGCLALAMLPESRDADILADA